MMAIILSHEGLSEEYLLKLLYIAWPTMFWQHCTLIHSELGDLLWLRTKFVTGTNELEHEQFV